MPDPAEILEQETLETEDAATFEEDDSDPQEIAAEEEEAKASPSPETVPRWQELGYANLEAYTEAVEKAWAKEADDKRQLTEEREANRRREDQSRAAASQTDYEQKKTEYRRDAVSRAVQLTGLPPEIAPLMEKFGHNIAGVIRAEYDAELAALARATSDALRNGLQPVRQISDQVAFRKYTPEQIHDLGDEALLMASGFEAMGLSPQQSRAETVRILTKARGNAQNPTQPAKPALRVARKPRMESADTGGGDAAPSSSKSWDKECDDYWAGKFS